MNTLNKLKVVLASSLLSLVLSGCNGQWCVKDKGCSSSSKNCASKRDYVLFPFDSNAISAEELEVVKANAHNSAPVMTVTGHCSKEGKPAYNVALGARRADAAGDALTKAGYNGHVKTVSYGASMVFVPGDTEAQLAPNRRAIFHTGAVAKPAKLHAKKAHAKKAAHKASKKAVTKAAIMK